MTDDNELSDREVEIIRLVATGASNKEIAHTLTISPNTVKVHLRNIFGKLGVLSRTEATMTAIRLGLVDSPGSENLPETISEISPFEIENLQFPQQDILQPYYKNQNFWLILGIGMVLMLVAGFFLNLFFSPPNGSEGGITTAELDAISSNRWSTIQDLTEPLSEMGFIRYENKFMLFGGINEEGISSKLLIYDIDLDVWKIGAEIPVALKGIQVAMLGEKIYLPGGIDKNNNVNSNLLIYNPRDNSWEYGQDLPIPTSGYALIPYEGKLFLFGGFDGLNYLSSIYVFDPETMDWDIFGYMPENRAYSSAVVLGGQIHLLGGMNETGVLKDHLVYFPQRELLEENSWEKAAEMPEARFGMNSIVLADMIYTAGGKGAKDEILPVIQYLPPKDTWVKIDTSPTEIGVFPAVLPYETRLYVMGGQNSNGFEDQALVYQAVYTILVPVISN